MRIGVHSAVATRRGSDYSGKEVHVAARIAALARGGEILASAATAAMAGPQPTSEPRLGEPEGCVWRGRCCVHRLELNDHGPDRFHGFSVILTAPSIGTNGRSALFVGCCSG